MNPGQRVGDRGNFSSSCNGASAAATCATYWLIELTVLMCDFKTVRSRFSLVAVTDLVSR